MEVIAAADAESNDLGQVSHLLVLRLVLDDLLLEDPLQRLELLPGRGPFGIDLGASRQGDNALKQAKNTMGSDISEVCRCYTPSGRHPLRKGL